METAEPGEDAGTSLDSQKMPDSKPPAIILTRETGNNQVLKAHHPSKGATIPIPQNQ
jgi:hypothetical protein